MEDSRGKTAEAFTLQLKHVTFKGGIKSLFVIEGCDSIVI